MEPNIVEIRDASGAASAEILTSQGFNCFNLSLVGPNGPINVLWASDDFRGGAGRASSSGIPILFPFPGRIANGTFSWEGKDYELETNDGMGNAIHGFVHTRPWQVTAVDTSSVTAQFDSASCGDELANRWPAEFRIEATYKIESDRLITIYQIDNPSEVSLPFGLGLHPYFRTTQLQSTNDANDEKPASNGDIDVRVPANRQWELENLIPSGKSNELGSDGALRKGESFADMNYDDVFGEMDRDGERICSTVDFAKSHRLIVESTSDFDVCVVYTPPHREAVCIEPYTCLPDLFEWQATAPQYGPTVLKPGDRMSYRVDYRIADLPTE